MLPWDGCILLGQPVVGLSNLKQVFFLIVSEDLCAIVIIWNFFRVCLLVSVRFGGGGVVVLFFLSFCFCCFFLVWLLHFMWRIVGFMCAEVV